MNLSVRAVVALDDGQHLDEFGVAVSVFSGLPAEARDSAKSLTGTLAVARFETVQPRRYAHRLVHVKWVAVVDRLACIKGHFVIADRIARIATSLILSP